MAIYNQLLVHWLDQNGKPATSFLTTLDQSTEPPGAYAPLVAALQACSDAAIVGYQFQSSILLDAAMAAGPYPTVFDRAMLRAKIAETGEDTRINVVGPRADIFLPGNLIVDLSSPLIVELDTQTQALLGDKHGHAFGPFFRGRRQEAGPVT